MKKTVCGILIAALMVLVLPLSALAVQGYSVSIREDQTRAVGETAEVSIEIRAEGFSSFNTADIELSYPADILEYQNSSPGGYTVVAKNGIVRIIGYGAARGLGNVLTLSFSVKKIGSAKIVLTEAKVDLGENALSEDMPAAKLGQDTVTITIAGYSVQLPEGFNGDDTVPPNGDYTFFADDPDHDCQISATMEGEPVEITDNRDGSYTIRNVTGPIVILTDETHEIYSVVFTGSGANDAAGEPAAEDGEDYVFSINKEDGYRYTVSAAVRGKTVGLRDNGDGTYTVIGESVHGDICIDIIKTETQGEEQADLTVTFDPMNGESSWSMTATPGCLIPEPELPLRDGYEFNGWYRDPSGEARWDFSTDKVERDMTLYAGWVPAAASDDSGANITEPEAHSGRTGLPRWILPSVGAAAVACILLALLLRRRKVVFISNGAVMQMMRVKKGSKITMPAIPRSEGHNFVGWYRDEALLKRWNFEEDTVQESMKLFAKWH